MAGKGETPNAARPRLRFPTWKLLALIAALLVATSPAFAWDRNDQRDSANPNWRTEIPFPRRDFRDDRPRGYYDRYGDYREECYRCGDEE